MADFKTHLATSTLLGLGYGAAAHFLYQFPADQSLLSVGLCSLAGMLPDLDSDSGVPVRETLAFAAAITPILMLDRLSHLGLSHAGMAVAAAAIYLTIRFGVGALFRHFTVHRGMWHSLPAAAVAGLLAFVACGCQDFSVQLLKALAVVLGFLSHLVLDEIWSLRWGWGGPRRKKSFGSACKLWGRNPVANVTAYAKLAFLMVWVLYADPALMEKLDRHAQPDVQTAREWVQDVLEAGRRWR